jgi:phage shock protein A
MNSTEAILQLHPAADQAALLEDYAERYAEAANWLSQKVFDAGVTDQVRLHRLYYNRLRDRFELPAQAAVLCLKHVARLCRKAVVAPRVSADGPVPFDRHLYSMKSVDAVSLSTLAGRVVVPCTLSTYAAGEFLVGSAELCRFDRDWVFILRTELPEDLLHRHSLRRDQIMPDTLLTRITRLVSGLTHSAIEQAEQAASVPIMEQAIRDIDDAVKEVRSEVGKHEATKHNARRRMTELQQEHDGLSEKIALAVNEEKEDLAEAGVGRQLDIENQLALLERTLAEADEEITKLTDSLAALQASRREAQSRLRDLKAAAPAGGEGGGGAGGTRAQSQAQAAMDAAQRLGEKFTGLPGEESHISNRDLDDLAELHRQHAIQERLAKHKARLRGGN